MAPEIADPYDMAVASIDEAVRNAVAVGADPDRMAILDNFCWPSCDDERAMGALVRACEACRDVALAYEIPFISGKDSLNNQFANSETGEVIRIPNTLLISAIGVIDDVRKCVTMDLKKPQNVVCLISPAQDLQLKSLSALHRCLRRAIGAGLVASCHDCSDGGMAVAAAEMCIASGFGLGLSGISPEAVFASGLGQYVVELRGSISDFEDIMNPAATVTVLGTVIEDPQLKILTDRKDALSISIDEMTGAWRRTLDW
jgi:phosphoribosylformylglycinamidine synthase